jgi:hypothetical protein
MIRKFLVAMPAALVLSGLSAQAHAVTPVYSDPVTAPAVIQASEVAAINATEAGATIDVANPFALCVYSQPLEAAMRRGVHVHWFTLAGTHSRFPCGSELARVLVRTPGSSVRICVSSCYNGTWASRHGGSSSMHAKTMQITHSDGTRVTYIGSNDWAKVNRREYNSVATTTCPRINDAVHRWFEGMARRKPIGYFPKVTQGCGETLYQFPNRHQTGADNVFMSTLQAVSCQDTTDIYVKQSQWLAAMTPVIDRMAAMKSDGCRFHILIGTKIGKVVLPLFQRDGFDDLRQSGVAGPHPGIHSHMKEFLVVHSQNGRTTWTDLSGSANMAPSWSGENQMLVWHPTPAQAAQSLAQFSSIWNRSHDPSSTEPPPS